MVGDMFTQCLKTFLLNMFRIIQYGSKVFKRDPNVDMNVHIDVQMNIHKNVHPGHRNTMNVYIKLYM